MTGVKRLTLTAILIASGIILGIVEANFLSFNALPGAKVGLSNIVCLVSLYLFDFKTALCVNSVRVIFAGLMYSGPSSIIYSFPAALVSLIMMDVVKKLFKEKVSPVGVSVAGAFFHNLTQIVVAMIISGSFNMIYYFSYLSIAGTVTGVLTGVTAYSIIKRIKKDMI